MEAEIEAVWPLFVVAIVLLFLFGAVTALLTLCPPGRGRPRSGRRAEAPEAKMPRSEEPRASRPRGAAS